MLKKCYTITDMECPSCAMRLEGLEDKLDGVKRVTASYHKRQMEVEFDETRVSEAQIIAAVEKLGYHVGA